MRDWFKQSTMKLKDELYLDARIKSQDWLCSLNLNIGGHDESASIDIYRDVDL